VRYIRQEYADYFGVAVAGYPEGHPNVIKLVEKQDVGKLSESERGRLVVTDEGEVMVCSDLDFKGEIEYLKAKVDAGANLIICQMFFDVEVFFTFVQVCRKAGINVPILPGIMPITKMAGFKKMIGFCKTRVPTDLRDRLESVKDDAEAVEKIGLEVMTRVCKRLADEGYGLHFYCLNQYEATYNILRNLNLLKEKK
jgi:methylenetetrahydrofolate reductase (NADPH)